MMSKLYPKLQTGGTLSQLGYKRHSPYNKAPSLLINTPTGSITMKEVDHPILGIGYNEIKFMLPNKEYQFKSNKVLEIPMRSVYPKAQMGAKLPSDNTRVIRNYELPQKFNQQGLRTNLVGGRGVNQIKKDFDKTGTGEIEESISPIDLINVTRMGVAGVKLATKIPSFVSSFIKTVPKTILQYDKSINMGLDLGSPLLPYKKGLKIVQNAYKEHKLLMNDPIFQQRLKNAGGDPTTLKMPRLTFDHRNPSYHDKDIININLGEIATRNKGAYTSVFPHEFRHVVQRNIHRTKFNEMKKQGTITGYFDDYFANEKNGTKLDRDVKSLEIDPYDMRKKHDRDYFYQGSNGHESYPFMVEMRQDMIDKGFLKSHVDETSPLNILEYLKTNKNNTRLGSLTEMNTNNINILHRLLNSVPAVVPAIVVGKELNNK